MAPAVLMAAAVFGAGSVERQSAVHAAAASAQSQRLLTAMLDQETGARGFFDTHHAVFLQPWSSGTASFSAGVQQMRSSVSGDAALEHQLADEAAIAADWHATTAAEIHTVMTGGASPSVSAALGQKALMDSFRAANAMFDRLLTQRRDAALSRGTWLAVLLAAALASGLSAAGLLLLRLTQRRAARRRRREAELREMLQVSDSEEESRLLLIHHIERTIPGAGAAILNRNNSDDRLEPVVGDRNDGGLLSGLPHGDTRPRDCLAVRLSRPHERHADEDVLTPCRICGKLAADVACEPLLVGGKVIGSVLVASPDTISAAEHSQLRDAVTQAAPVIAHQRNLSLAQRRAAMDALTGLPNRRSADDTIKRMAAQAGRSMNSLAAVLMDLDHFKEINDVHGHDQGDEVLAEVGPIITATLRASDFAARYGGEEFLLLLPDTTAEQAQVAAEKLRAAIEQAGIGPTRLTASFGVAALPADASDPERLVRKADQALYAAKQAGRNCVKLASDASELAEH